MLENPRARGAQGRADGDFFLAAKRLCQYQIGNVGARDEQHKSDGAQQHQQRRADLTNGLFAQRHDLGTPTFVVFGILLFKTAGDRIHLGLGLLGINAPLQPRDHQEMVLTANCTLLVGPDQRCPHLRKVRLSEVRSHDTDNGEGLAIEIYAATDNVRIRPKMVLPERIAQDDDIAAPRLVLVGSESTPQHGRRAQHGKETGFDAACMHHFRIAEAGQVITGEAVDRRLLEDVVLAAPIQVVCRRDRKPRHPGEAFLGRRVPELHQAIRVIKRQWPQQDCIHHAENSCIGADAKRQHDHGGGTETGTLYQEAHSVPKILKDAGHLSLLFTSGMGSGCSSC